MIVAPRGSGFPLSGVLNAPATALPVGSVDLTRVEREGGASTLVADATGLIERNACQKRTFLVFLELQIDTVCAVSYQINAKRM